MLWDLVAQGRVRKLRLRGDHDDLSLGILEVALVGGAECTEAGTMACMLEA
jgi:hypothetical protein